MDTWASRPARQAQEQESINDHTPDTVGVDVSKAHLDVHRRATGESARFANDDDGFEALAAWIGTSLSWRRALRLPPPVRPREPMGRGQGGRDRWHPRRLRRRAQNRPPRAPHRRPRVRDRGRRRPTLRLKARPPRRRVTGHLTPRWHHTCGAPCTSDAPGTRGARTAGYRRPGPTITRRRQGLRQSAISSSQ